ncbi:hypothetical protein AB0L75_11040 [Streptomyces sp. NPDC052101]
MLAARTASGARFPAESGYTAAAMTATIAISRVLRRTAEARLP